MTDTTTTTTTTPAAAATTAPPIRATAVRASVATLMDQIVAAIGAGTYPDGIPSDLDAVSKTSVFRAKTLRAAG